ncbi:MAG: site-specific DNA-methyltransferase [bacterium]|nr:site-specific DNA-methyltransferase [bacterium]
MNRQKYQIWNADAFEWLPKRRSESIHAVVTDPPFGLVEYMPDQLRRLAEGKGGIWRLPHNYDGHQRSPMPRFTVLGPSDRAKLDHFHQRLAPLLHNVLVPGGHVIIASQNLLSHIVVGAFCGAGFELRGQIVRVVKTLRGGDRPKGAHERFPWVSVSPRSSWELWLIFRRPCEGRVRDNLEKWGTGALRRPADGTPFRDLIQSSPARGEERRIAPHPSLKPQAFMRQIVRAALPLGKGVILDPFMGSGATIAAAHHLGLSSIGLELHEEYFRLARRAIPALSRLNLDGSEPPSEDP